jgi:hypothetical protein
MQPGFQLNSRKRVKTGPTTGIKSIPDRMLFSGEKKCQTNFFGGVGDAKVCGLPFSSSLIFGVELAKEPPPGNSDLTSLSASQ